MNFKYFAMGQKFSYRNHFAPAISFGAVLLWKFLNDNETEYSIPQLKMQLRFVNQPG